MYHKSVVALSLLLLGLTACGGGGGGGAPATAEMGGAIQGKALNLTNAVSTLAGDGTASYADKTGTQAEFNLPERITTDGTNLYVADTWNNRIRKIVIATGAVTTIAGDGNYGFADNANGMLAEFKKPYGITTDGTNLYVADSFNERIRKIVIASGAVTTIAGDGTYGYVDNTNGMLAEFGDPSAITTDGTNLYVADSSTNRIRKIVIATDAVTTVAGDGNAAYADNTNGMLAEFNIPLGITTDGTNLYVADMSNNRIRKIVIASGAVTTVAGDGTPAFADNANGMLAEFNEPYGITTDGTNLYVGDTGNNRIRKIVIATGAVTTVAGDGTAGYLDKTGTQAEFNQPKGITTDGTKLYVADQGNNRIREIQ